MIEFRWQGQEDVVQYVAADADDPLTVQSLFSTSFSRDGVFVIGNWFTVLCFHALLSEVQIVLT